MANLLRCGPEESRTPDPYIANVVLWPTELLAQSVRSIRYFSTNTETDVDVNFQENPSEDLAGT